MANEQPNPPRFVLSYARRERDKFLERFFRDLRHDLAIKEGLDPDDDESGFLDTDAIPGGADWSATLAYALASSWACVSLYSPNYFKREACGKEVQVFLDRSGVQYDASGQAQNARGILPVLWASMDDLVRNGLPPNVVKLINFRSTKHQKRYEAEGLRSILRRSPKTVYVDILADIVRDLIGGFERKPTAMAGRPNFAAVKDAFATLAAAAPAPRTAVGPTSLALFLVAAPGATGLFTAVGAGPWIDRLRESDPNLTAVVTVIDPGASPPVLVPQVEVASASNALVLIVVDPTTAAAQQTSVLALLQAVVTSERWTGTIAFPGVSPADSAMVRRNLQVPAVNLDRLHITTIGTGGLDAAGAVDVEPVVVGVRALLIEILRRVVSDSDVKRRPPGGGTPAERPKVRGPGEKTVNG